jgi:hypothetical protein
MSCGDGRALPRHIYLNFGDVIISIDRKHVPAFPAAGIDVKGLAGKRVRVRGLDRRAQRADDRRHSSRAARAVT